MNSIFNEMRLLKELMNMLESHFGTDLEVVLHDLTNGEASTIVDIRNGEITHRTHGGIQAHHGMVVVQGVTEGDNHYGEIVYTEDGKILRGSTLKIRNEKGDIIGSLCINQDITKMIEIENYLKTHNRFQIKDNTSDNINELLDDIIQQAHLATGKHVSTMTKKDKLVFLKYLDDRGAFLISKSGPRVCSVLGISKYTLYSYLDIIRNQEPFDNIED